MAIDENEPFFCVENSDNALTTIIDRGLLGKFPAYTGTDESHVAFIIDVNHPKHWLVACHFVGHTANGVKSPYAIFGMLKSEYSYEDVQAFAQSIGNELGATAPPSTSFLNPDAN